MLNKFREYLISKGFKEYAWRYADEQEVKKHQKNKNQLEFKFK